MDLITMVLACSLYTDNSITNAIAQVGSKDNPLTITSENGERKVFKTQTQAAAYAATEIRDGHAVDIGLMQIPSRWLHDHKITVTELLGPCKNIVVATQILNNAAQRCSELQADQPADALKVCTLSMYKTGDAQAGADYAHTVLEYADAHPFDNIIAAAKKKNPKEFVTIPHLPEKKSAKVSTKATTPDDETTPADQTVATPTSDDSTANDAATDGQQ